jgi:hypothetical protein
MPSKKVIAWDKAFYYVGVINRNYDDVWFIEDDVFFKSEDDYGSLILSTKAIRC